MCLNKDINKKWRLILAAVYLQFGLSHLALGQVTKPHEATALSTSSQSINWHKLHLKRAHFAFELGGFFSFQGADQDIGIQGLAGDQYTVTDNQSSNGLVGVGYFLKGLDKPRYTIDYGLEAFFGRGTVYGTIIQEHVFTNLAYSYNIDNFPLYAAVKGLFKTKKDRYGVILNAGIGPNFMKVYTPQESSLGNDTIPDYAFLGKTNTVFTAMAGLGFRINQVFGPAPLECGYRFFYLGQGQFKPRTNQLLNSLKTGQSYAHAVMCGILI